MTGFFHVPSAFGVLEEKVIPVLFSDRPSEEPIRVWVAGCATGEEAYSVAILLFEYASTLNASPTIEIYATDNDQDALNTAQKGFYPGSIVDQMSSVCLGKYFEPDGDGFSVIPEIKAAVHFSSHDVLIDNSFQSFELITCRHLLAYLDQASQSQIVTFFHHSLRPEGFLFLGDAEFAESLPVQFEAVDDIFKIYQLEKDAEPFHIDTVEAPDDDDDTIPTIVDEEIEPIVAVQVEEVVAPEVSAEAETEIVEQQEEAGDGMLVEPMTEVIAEAPEAVEDTPPEEAFVEDFEAVETETAEAKIVEPVVEAAEEEIVAETESDEEIVAEVIPEDQVVTDETATAEEAPTNDFSFLDDLELTPINDGQSLVIPEIDLNEAPSSEESAESMAEVVNSDYSPAQNIAADFESDGPGFGSISVDPPFEEEPMMVANPTPANGPANEIITQLHRSVMLQDYAPASLLIDRSFKILDQTGRIDRVFDVKARDLTRDYLDQLPDFYRLKLEETLNQIFFEKDASSAPLINLPALPGKHDVQLEMQYMSSPDPTLEIVHVLFKEKQGAKKKAEGSDDTVSFFASPAVEPEQSSNGVFGAETEKGTFEENFIRSIRTAPFAMLLHAEGGNIIELSQPWVEMAGVNKEEAPTISAWTKKVRGQRLKLKDSKLKASYQKRGIVCISIRTKTGDTKLLAFHSTFMGSDSKGRKMTMTMAVDITNYPGHSGMGITPEIADFGVAAKKTFLANMSHEVRTPLTSMIGFADYLSDKLTGQDVQFARYISESGNRLLETLNAVLRISSMDGIEQVMRYEMLDITVEAQGILQLFKPYAEQYGIPLKLVVEQPAKAKLDRASLRRILANLLGNAIKFTPEGEVTITVNSDVNSVIVEIEDTGIGITEEFLPFIFDRFAQESKGQGRAYSGCGLGLSICKRLVEAMEGTIQVETESGVGSKFTVKLPKEPQQRSQPTSAITPADGDNDKQVDRPQILIVEDNTDTQELMLLILRDKYEVTITSNAAETLKIINNRTFDAILMDLNLGGRRTGFELIRELRQVNAYEGIPVLAVSALPIGVIRKQLIREGFNGYIAKPFTRARILDALEGVLNLTS